MRPFKGYQLAERVSKNAASPSRENGAGLPRRGGAKDAWRGVLTRLPIPGWNQKRHGGVTVRCAILDEGRGVAAGLRGWTCRADFASFTRFRVSHQLGNELGGR